MIEVPRVTFCRLRRCFALVVSMPVISTSASPRVEPDEETTRNRRPFSSTMPWVLRRRHAAGEAVGVAGWVTTPGGVL